MKKYLVILLLCSQVMAWAQVKKDTLRVGLLLPLQTEVMKRDKSMDRFVDFYSGALLAVYEMQAKGQAIVVHTWDVGKSTGLLQKVMASGEMNRMEMVLGPVYATQIQMMCDWAKQHKVRTLLPFSSEVPQLESNPYLMQFNPSHAVEADAIAEYLTNGNPKRCIMVQAGETTVPASVREIQRCIKSYSSDYVYTTIEAVMADSLGQYLASDRENVLLMNTERYANLRIVMPQILRAAQGKNLNLISRYSWQEESIILPQIYTTVFKQEMDTAAYQRLYNRFYSTPRVSTRPCYDLLGYDLMKYTLETLQAMHESNGMLDEEDIVSRYCEGLQSDVQFERISSDGGYLNVHVKSVKTE